MKLESGMTLFAIVGSVRATTPKKLCKYDKYGLIVFLLFLFFRLKLILSFRPYAVVIFRRRKSKLRGMEQALFSYC